MENVNLGCHQLESHFVFQVVSQWWNQFSSLAWPDTFAMNLASYCPGRGKAYKVLFFSATSLNLRSLAGAASVRALRQPGEHDGVEEAELVRGKKVSHL